MGETRVFDGSGSPSASEVAEAIRGLDRDEPEQYRVEWRSENRHHPSTTYTITKISFGEGGRPLLEIEGGRGGRYVVDSNPPGEPMLRYLKPDGDTLEERLVELQIFERQLGWRDRLAEALF